MIAELHRRLEDERAEARTIVEEILQRGRAVLDTELPRRYYTVEVARELSRRAVEQSFVDNNLGMTFAQIAVAIASRIDEHAWPRPLVPSVRAEAFKNLSTCHRLAGSFPAAHRALDAAERAIRNERALSYDRAVLQLARATLIVGEAKSEGVVALVNEALELFREYQDQQRVGQCLHVLGMFHFLRAEYREAAGTLREAADLALKSGDYRGSASLASALGHTLVELGDLGGAAAALGQARSITRDLGDPSEDLHVTWGFAKLQRVQGQHAAAMDTFANIAGQFHAMQQFEDAGMCWLEGAESAIALGVPGIARGFMQSAIAAFSQANLPERLATALAYARELADSDAPREEAVRHVRRYLRERPQELFLQLPPRA